MAKRSAFKQGALTGLCGPYGIVNAFSLLYPGQLSPTEASALAHHLAAALPWDLATIMREGTDRVQMELMLTAAARWTRDQGWPAWTCEAVHPRPGMTARAFWSGLATRLMRGATAIVGFGDHHRLNTRYEPHWTCVARVAPRTIHLLDSDEYEHVARSATGIRPEPGWEIEDCFLLGRVDACSGMEDIAAVSYGNCGSIDALVQAA
jgi:hypothetical protein